MRQLYTVTLSLLLSCKSVFFLILKKNWYHGRDGQEVGTGQVRYRGDIPWDFIQIDRYPRGVYYKAVGTSIVLNNIM